MSDNYLGHNVFAWTGPSFLWCFYVFWISIYEVYSFKIQWNFSAFRHIIQSKQSKFKAYENFPKFRRFRFCPITKIENSVISEYFFFTSKFERSYNLDAKTTTNFMRQELKDQDMFWLKKWEFSRFLSSWFCPIPKIENSEISESALLLQILRFVLISDSETIKMNWHKNLKVKICFQKKKIKFPRFLSFQFFSTPKIDNSEISESLLLLQILIVVVT